MDDCIFCRIVAGELPAYKVAEDDQTLAFLDIQPAGQGHTLIIPKQHSENLFDTLPEDLAAVATMCQQVAQRIEQVLTPDGINVLQNNRPAAGQVVMHYHVHILPRWNDDRIMRHWRPKPPSDINLDELAASLRITEV